MCLVALPAAEASLVTLSLYPSLPAGRGQQRAEAVLALARGQRHHFVERCYVHTRDMCPGGSKKRERKGDYIENACVSLVNLDDLQLFRSLCVLLLDHTREQRTKKVSYLSL